jgi:ribosomal protein S18 acetylase RimI-like enzyme
MRRSTFAQAAIGEGAAALNRVFHEYAVPLTFSSEQLHLHMSYNDVEASASPLWYDESGAFLAAALLGIRGKRGWIGGFGVAPEHRGHGVAAELLDDVIETARARGLQTIALEVLEDNLPAIGAYKRAGFEIERKLYSFETISGDAPAPAGSLAASPRALIDEPDVTRPCWQRERVTLHNGAVSTAVLDARGNFALFRFNAELAQVLKLHAGSAEELSRLAEAIASGRPFQSVMLLNEPEESPIGGFAREAGWMQPLTQYEMILRL